ncbi:MAG: sigma-70 family RNA polymerase sigma factor [Desulfocapsaceae bacterium]|nr:sigma-70 family RNA polymerase sigma factor [Desulfocapsaceae bacterium]
MNIFFQKDTIVDLLKTIPSQKNFEQRIQLLGLSDSLEQKTLKVQALPAEKDAPTALYLQRRDEKELATEVLLHRHKFTQSVFENRIFRQAALTVIQNIYLFKQRRIFFGTTKNYGEPERQQALQLFGSSSPKATIKLIHTFQHLMVARIWDRITSQASPDLFASDDFQSLHEVVENLNTLRNIYMILSTGLVRKLTRRINPLYSQSISPDDARQIGSFGIARAAYRYHPTNGMRFSTYAAYWILREIQRQALAGRLIRVSANLVDNFVRESKHGTNVGQRTVSEKLSLATPYCMSKAEHTPLTENVSSLDSPENVMEKQELIRRLIEEMGRTLPAKSKDVLERRFGIGRFAGGEQSVIEIAKEYGVSRSSIYQLEQNGLRKLRIAMADTLC